MSRRKSTSTTPPVAAFVAYYRVSTERQGRSGLGLEAQQVAVAKYLAGIPDAALARAFTDVESGRRSDRPELHNALELCRITGVTLIVAKLDRLSRDVDFLRQCVREIDGAGVVFCDLPDLPPGAAGKLVLTVVASERRLIAHPRPIARPCYVILVLRPIGARCIIDSRRTSHFPPADLTEMMFGIFEANRRFTVSYESGAGP